MPNNSTRSSAPSGTNEIVSRQAQVTHSAGSPLKPFKGYARYSTRDEIRPSFTVIAGGEVIEYWEDPIGIGEGKGPRIGSTTP